MRPPSPAERRRLLRFAVTGCGCVLVDLTAYTLLAGPVSRHAAKGLAYLAGVVVGFFANKFWTFESSRRTAAEPAWYLGVYATTLLVNVAVNAGVTGLTESPRLAFLAATGVTTVLNYLGLRWLTFRPAAEGSA